jgi:Protein of unknown function (Hypoth_ymh)
MWDSRRELVWLQERFAQEEYILARDYLSEKVVENLAGIEYHGSPGVTAHCLQAITRLLFAGEELERAWLLSAKFRDGTGVHCFVLHPLCGDLIGIKSGFASGYGGEGPKGLETALTIFRLYEIDVQEFEVAPAVIERLDNSCLLKTDIEGIQMSRAVHPTKTADYQSLRCLDDPTYPIRQEHLYPPRVNLGSIDPRLVDLALELHLSPDSVISTTYRRLEDTVRNRTKLSGESGQRLMSKAFEGPDSLLHWNDDNAGEQAGKAGLFKSVFLAFRNPRAHKELARTERELLREFMLVNELFQLESKACRREIE